MGITQYSFERLEVWQEAMQLAARVYQITKTFPKDEWYGIVSQMRRAAASIPANIAEGRGRFSKKEQVQFFYNARGSLYELLTFLKLVLQLDYLKQSDYLEAEMLCNSVLGKLSGLINAMKVSIPSPFTLHPSPSR